MHVHIANLAAQSEPVTVGVRGIPGIDIVYLLNSSGFEAVANQTKSMLELMGYKCEIREINGFRFQEIIDRITDIYEETYGKGTEYSINITGGNNLMAAAACYSTPITGAKLYYVLYDKNNPDQPINERIIEIPVPKMRNVGRFKNNERLILSYLREKGSSRKTDIACGTGISPQLCGRYLVALEEERLIEVVKSFSHEGKTDNRSHTVTLTKEGRIVASWF